LKVYNDEEQQLPKQTDHLEDQEEEEEEEQQEPEQEEEECDQKSNIPDIPSLLNIGGLPTDLFSHFNADRKSSLSGQRSGKKAGVLLDTPLVGDQLLQAMQLCGSPYFSQLAVLQQQHNNQTGNQAAASFTGTFTSFAAGSARGGAAGATSPDLKSGFLGSAPVRRYKQYTEDRCVFIIEVPCIFIVARMSSPNTVGIYSISTRVTYLITAFQ
jgi:hypothetical protein